MKPLLVAFVMAGTAGSALAQQRGVLTVGGEVGKPRQWSLEALQKAAPVQTVQTTLKGKPYTVRGVPLWALVRAAEPRFDVKTKHSEARFVVLVRGADGYMCSFALADVMPDVRNASVLVVWEANGKRLSPKEGPLRLVVKADKKPMRWVYKLASFEIYDAKRLAPLR